MSSNNDIHRRIGDSIARLFRLSRQMEQHVRAKIDSEGDDYEPEDKNDKLRMREYREHLEWKLDNHPSWKASSDFIKDRLRETMLIRGRRILFHSARVRQKDTATPRRTSHEQKVPRRSETPTTVVASRTVGAGGSVHHVTPQESHRTAQTKSSQSATGLTSFKPHEDRESIATSKRTKSLIGVKRADFPKAPAILSELLGFICPLCGSRQPTKEHEHTLWQ